MTILQSQLNAKGETPEQEIARLRSENAALRAKAEAAKNAKLSMKVSDKGALSVYGLGRFPVTLYRGQWERLIANVEGLKAFIEANADELVTKE